MSRWSIPTEQGIDHSIDLIMDRIAERYHQPLHSVWDNWSEYVAMCNATGLQGSFEDFREVVYESDE